MNKLIILSDIHANLSALDSVLAYARENGISKFILLGDLIDYGMRPNEVIARLSDLGDGIVHAIAGNHEDCYFKKDYRRFSSDRGRAAALYSEKILNQRSRCFLERFRNSGGLVELSIQDLSVLLIHGSISDPFWGKIDPSVDPDPYSKYDVVFSGHTHKAFDLCKSTSNGKQVRFINCGSIGQPRNGDVRAQFLVADFSQFEFNLCCVDYDIQLEQSLYDGSVDEYYKNRLSLGA